MCGIAGWVSRQKDLRLHRSTLFTMREVLQHRGPDERGSWISDEAGLVHRRLIVIDPAGGKQPMVRVKNGHKYVLVYNGELYNTPELRKKLKKNGYSFRGHSDTEVLINAYIEWGERCVEHLNGIFAFAVWNESQQTLYLARDRIGVKPLFYHRQPGGGIIFASEIKSILSHPEVRPVINREGLAEIFAVGPGRTPGKGVFRDIKELKPGHYLVFSGEGLEKKVNYWTPVSKPHEDDLQTTIARIRYLFTDAVKRQLVSDVPLCTLLSGGLDSSAITAVAARELEKAGKPDLHTYSVNYEGNEKFFTANEFQPGSDGYWIQKVSDFLGTEHHRVTLNNMRLANNLKNGVYARDLPGMADIDVSLYLFCREIKKKYTVAVSGECADEIFGGYPWYYREEALNADIFPWSRNLSERVKILAPGLVRKIKPEDYVYQRYREALAEVPVLAAESSKEARLREIFYLNLTRWMQVLLARKDRMSMYTGLEVRVPFCDHRLVEYVWNIPWSMKNYGGMRKGIFREALKGVIPEEVRKRPKNPYPKTFNPEYYQAVRKLILNTLAEPQAPLNDFIDRQEVKNLVESDEKFTVPWFGQLMRLPQLLAYLYQVNFWLREYKIEVDSGI